MAKKDLALFFRQSLYRRLDAQDFHDLLTASKRWDLNGTDLVNNLLNCAYGFCLEDDPLIASYLRTIVQGENALVTDFIAGLALRWRKVAKVKTDHVDQYVRRTGLLLRDLISVVQSRALSEADWSASFILSARWLRGVAKATNINLNHLSENQANVLASFLSFLILALIRSSTGDALLTKTQANKMSPLKTALQQAVDVSMEAFPNISMQLMAETQKYPRLLDAVNDPATDGNVAALAFEENINTPPIMPGRQADYVLLYNFLASSKTIDEGAISSFMSTRHTGDTLTALTDLLYGFFDSMTRPFESTNPVYILQCRIFLLNRLPSIMSLICAFQSLSSEANLVDIWNHVNAINRPDLVTVAAQFLHICALYHLISPDTLSTLVVANNESNRITGLDRKENLVQKVHESSSRGPRLVDELGKNDGNSAALSLAIVEVMHGCCRNRQTELLKDMANALIRKPGTLQAIAMFVQPSMFLAPMCTLLDEWNWQDIHGESQPVYEEFGSVLLLLITMKHKLGLGDDEMGISQGNGFVARYMSSNDAERDLSQLTDEEQQHLGDWINALYIAGVLSDDLTTNCSAQEFHLLVPTLLRQSSSAFLHGKLPEEQLRQGLEYLLEPSLLPALPAAFTWLSNFAPTEPKLSTIIIQVLAKAPGQLEGSEIHATIMSMASNTIRHGLGAASIEPQYADMLVAIGPYMQFNATEPATAEDLSLWTTSEGGIRGALQRALSDLIGVSPQGLYQQSLVTSTLRIHGPEAVVRDLVTLLVQFSSNTEFHHLLDIAATFIVTAQQSGISMRHHLQLLRSQLPTFLRNGEQVFAEALIHLSQRVELYGNALTPHATSLDPNLILPTVDIANINLDDVPVPTLDVQQQQPQSQQQQLNDPQDELSGENMEEMLNQAAAMGTVDELDTTMNETDMFDFGTDTFDLGNLDSVDFDSF